jgi:hypothetical protein
MNGTIHPLPQYAFMAWCLVKAQGQLYLFYLLLLYVGNRGSSVSIETRLRVGRQGFNSRKGQRWDFFFSSPQRPDLLWGPPIIPSNGYWRTLYLESKAARGVKLTTHLHLVPRLSICGAIPPLLQYVFMAWCLVKQRDRMKIQV